MGPAASESFVTLKNVSRKFDSVVAVRDVSLEIPSGVIFGLVGSDGAGKSTLLRMVATMIPPDSGEISIDGLDVVSQKKRIKELIGYMPQRFGLYRDLTVRENLDFFMDIFGITGKERAGRRERYLGFSNLLPFEERLAGDLSGGMKQKLGLACVLVHEPRLLILDEPTNGVDPVSRQEFWDILLQMRDRGMTILISTAYLDEGEKCGRLALMHNSRILVTGTPGEVRGGNPDLEEALIERIREVDAALVDEKFEY
jgi:ABC-2 type transport system ATP-binding protein